MYALGVLSGMIIAWVWLAYTSPKARKSSKQIGVVQVRCNHCGGMDWVSYNDVRVDQKCTRCR